MYTFFLMLVIIQGRINAIVTRRRVGVELSIRDMVTQVKFKDLFIRLLFHENLCNSLMNKSLFIIRFDLD